MDNKDSPQKPVINDDKKEEEVTKEEKEEAQPQAADKKVATRNIVHTIVDVLGKDDNVNRIRNIADLDITDKWSFDAYPLQGVVYLGDPPKQIDYIRVASENEQPYIIDFANSNTLTGYGKSQKGTLKRGLNDIKVKTIARYVRFEFPGNKKLDENKDQKPDPLGIYYMQFGQGEIDNSKPLPAPGPISPLPEPVEEPTRPTDGRIKVNNDTKVKGWGADYEKGAAFWKVEQMKQNIRFYKVVDKEGVNVADMFHSPDNANVFINWYKWKQGANAEKEGDNQPDPDPEPRPRPEPPKPPGPTPQPGGTGTDKNGVQLLVSKGGDINYTVKNNFRDDGKRFDANVGDWSSSEATAYFRFTKDPVDDEISIKWSEKSHSGNADVQCYDTGVKIKTGKTRMRFEQPHPEYSGNIGGGQGEPQGTKWIGYKGAKIVNGDGTVTIRLWQDTGDNEGDKPANNWKEIYSHTDSKYKRTGAHPYVTFRVDDPDKKGQKNLEIKWVSIAKI